jgi:hypothetical protein
LKKTRIKKQAPLLLADDCDCEDPRLWEEDGRLMLSWARVRDTRHEVGEWTVTQWLAEINDNGRVLSNKEWILPGIASRPVEKNWTRLPGGGVYYHFGEGLSVNCGGRLMRTRPVKLTWGTLFGGTPALPWPERGTWLAFYHGAGPHPTRVKRYYFGALEIDPKTHEIVRMSRSPLVWASDEDETIPCPRDPHYNPSVVFPAGIFRRDGLWHVTGGVHDSRDAVWRFADDDLHLVPTRIAERTNRILVSPNHIPPRGFATVRVRKMLSECLQTYSPGECMVVSCQRAAALGPLVEILTI